ncbi:uncharacterized protein LOC131335434 [Rhododendron vialii]|uniref:uncharacterized protein LOC131335434 n=1 Tax=Rhododendron vialii TaxID=182163 RepID=UPI00265E2272|nr:uncharacterized protein LOC131335434 [Rhododendron vialii]
MKSSMPPLYPKPKVVAMKDQENKSGRGNDFRERKGNMSDIARVKGADAVPKKLESKASMDINECAEEFINRFKQQLLIQRLESIESYEQMLARGK